MTQACDQTTLCHLISVTTSATLTAHHQITKQSNNKQPKCQVFSVSGTLLVELIDMNIFKIVHDMAHKS